MEHIRGRGNWASPRPYSAGVAVTDMVFLSGHVPVDAKGATVPGNCRAQSAAVLANLERTLQAGGLGRDAIVSTTAYLTDMADIDQMDEAYREFFGPDGPYPSRTTLGVSSLGRVEFTVEISAIATVRGATE